MQRKTQIVSHPHLEGLDKPTSAKKEMQGALINFARFATMIAKTCYFGFNQFDFEIGVNAMTYSLGQLESYVMGGAGATQPRISRRTL